MLQQSIGPRTSPTSLASANQGVANISRGGRETIQGACLGRLRRRGRKGSDARASPSAALGSTPGGSLRRQFLTMDLLGSAKLCVWGRNNTKMCMWGRTLPSIVGAQSPISACEVGRRKRVITHAGCAFVSREQASVRELKRRPPIKGFSLLSGYGPLRGQRDRPCHGRHGTRH